MQLQLQRLRKQLPFLFCTIGYIIDIIMGTTSINSSYFFCILKQNPFILALNLYSLQPKIVTDKIAFFSQINQNLVVEASYIKNGGLVRDGQ